MFNQSRTLHCRLLVLPNVALLQVLLCGRFVLLIDCQRPDCTDLVLAGHHGFPAFSLFLVLEGQRFAQFTLLKI